MAGTPPVKRPVSEKQRAALSAHAFRPGTNSLSGETHRRGPDKIPRNLKLLSRLLMMAFYENDGATMRKMIDRFQKLPDSQSDFAFLRFAQFARDTLDGKPGTVDESKEKAPRPATYIFPPGHRQPAPAPGIEGDGAPARDPSAPHAPLDIGPSTLLDGRSLTDASDRADEG
jgi:hypothetical protein